MPANLFLVYNTIMANPSGRPKKSPEESLVERIDLRLTAAERLEFEQAAKRDGKKLSEWIRNCLAEAAKRTAKGG
jgi:uncharacterized protein (DUF1778 family)